MIDSLFYAFIILIVLLIGLAGLNTAASDLAKGGSIIIYGEEGAKIKWYEGAANTYKPGDFVYVNAAGTITQVISSTAATKVTKFMVITDHPRLNLTTKARRDVDDDFQDQTTAYYPVLVGKKTGSEVIFVGKITDQNATVQEGNAWEVSATAGAVTIATTTNQAAGYIEGNFTNVEQVADGDTYAKFALD